MRSEEFFKFARTRHDIYVNRTAGLPKPWTQDPILLEYKFTNIFRELDRTTVWFRDNIRNPLRLTPDVLFATIAFRWFNRISTGEAILRWGNETFGDPLAFANRNRWAESLFVESLENYIRQQCTDGWVTGAYLIKTPDGMDKLAGVIENIRNVSAHEEFDETLKVFESGEFSMQGLTVALQEFDYLGPFMAYEVACDLRFTPFMEGAPDILTWANPGPGARRGIHRLMNLWDDPRLKRRSGKRAGQRSRKQGELFKREEYVKIMQDLVGMSRDPIHWPPYWPKWEMREAEHTLCEFDKYERIRLGEGKTKQRFAGAPPTP